MTLPVFLDQHLAELERTHLRRELLNIERSDGIRLQVGNQRLLSFASNDYLGLTRHPQVRAAAIEAIREFGVGAASSRLISGTTGLHHDLERALAEFKQADAALTFSSGYATALGVIPSLVGAGDFIVLDRLAHACLVDAARLSGAKLRVYRHNDLDDLRRILRWCHDRRRSAEARPGNVLIITESVFSMDGDRAPLREIVALKEEEDAWLLVDEAHATGVIGENRRGLAEVTETMGRIEILMGTLGKALASAGGFITGNQSLRDYLLNRSRSFVFSTAPPAPVVAAARTAVRIVRSPEGARLAGELWARMGELYCGLRELGWNLASPASPILPLMIGPELEALNLAKSLREEEGLLVPAIRYPTVARDHARLRLTVSAAHSQEDIGKLLRGLHRAMDRTGVRPARIADR